MGVSPVGTSRTESLDCRTMASLADTRRIVLTSSTVEALGAPGVLEL